MANNIASRTEDLLTKLFDVCGRNKAGEAKKRQQREDNKLTRLQSHRRQPWWTKEST